MTLPAKPTSDSYPRPQEGEWEVQDNGVPYYKFPPWPVVPPDTEVVPFANFTPLGVNPADEIDGIGIQAVELEAKHTGETSKKRKRRRPGGPLGAGVSIVELWEEPDRGPIHMYDMNEPESSRLDAALRDFRLARTWTAEMQSVNDNFCAFVGQVAHPNQLISGRKTKNVSAPDDANDFSDDEGAPMDVDPPAEGEAPAEPEAPTEAVVEELPEQEQGQEQKYEPDPEQKLRDARMDRFLNEPERAIKIWLSSYFVTKGLIWQPKRLEYGPLFTRSLLEFLIRRNIFPNIRVELERCLGIVKTAQEELPATRAIAFALCPEQFGEVCKQTFGITNPAKQGEMVWNLDEPVDPTPAPASDPTPDPAPAPAPVPSSEDPADKEFAAAMETLDPNAIALDDSGNVKSGSQAQTGENAGVTGSGWGPTAAGTGSGWGAADGTVGTGWDSTKVTVGAGWGDNAEQATSGEWAKEEGAAPTDWSAVPADAPAQRTIQEWTGQDAATLMQQRSEYSTRRIVRFTLPNPGVTGPGKQLCGLVLAPWNGQFHSDIPERTMFFDHGAEGEYDGSEEITVFLHPDAAGKDGRGDSFRVGMAVQGVWVQVIEKPVEVKEEQEEGAKKRKKRGKKGAAQGWWYAEDVSAQFVSFWEHDSLEGQPASDDKDDDL